MNKVEVNIAMALDEDLFAPKHVFTTEMDKIKVDALAVFIEQKLGPDYIVMTKERDGKVYMLITLC